MFFELSKLLNFFLSPITWILLSLIGFLVFKCKVRKRVCLLISILFFLFFTNHLLVDYIRYCTVKEYTSVSIDTAKRYKVAIVMGGFASMNVQTGQMRYEQDRADRLWEAIRLWKKGQIGNILITGDPTSILQEDGTSTRDLFLNYMEELGVPRTAFILEQQARNTHENAKFTKEILEAKQIAGKECILITSATHIRRSLKCFAKIGLHPDFLSVNTYDAPSNINHRSFYPDWKAAVKWQELLNEWIGDWAYTMMGYM